MVSIPEELSADLLRKQAWERVSARLQNCSAVIAEQLQQGKLHAGALVDTQMIAHDVIDAFLLEPYRRRGFYVQLHVIRPGECGDSSGFSEVKVSLFPPAPSLA